MKRSNSYAKSSLVPTLGFIALFLFGLNFVTGFSRAWDDWKAHRPKCWSAEARALQHRFHYIHEDRIEREMARSEREVARFEREMARFERELKHMEFDVVPPVPPTPPAPPRPPRIVIVR